MFQYNGTLHGRVSFLQPSNTGISERLSKPNREKKHLVGVSYVICFIFVVLLIIVLLGLLSRMLDTMNNADCLLPFTCHECQIAVGL